MIVYKATNKSNGKIYIGQTIKKLNKRISEHKSDSKRRNDPFPRAIAKHGVNNFSWEVIEVCLSQIDLDTAESKWISYYNSQNRNIGYNVASGGNPGKDIGRKNLSQLWKTDEFRKKMKDATRAGSRKLTDQDIGIIKKAYELYGSMKCIAEVFGVFYTTIEPIVYGKRWTDILPISECDWPENIKPEIERVIELNAERRKKTDKKTGELKRALTVEQIAFIKFMKNKGVNMKVLAEYFHVSYSLVNKIGYGGKFPDIVGENLFPELVEILIDKNQERISLNKMKSRNQLRVNRK